MDGEFTASPHVKKLSILQLSSASAGESILEICYSLLKCFKSFQYIVHSYTQINTYGTGMLLLTNEKFVLYELTTKVNIASLFLRENIFVIQYTIHPHRSLKCDVF